MAQQRKSLEQSRLGVRISGDLAKRIERILPRVAKDSRVAALGKVTVSTVVKLALARGLEALEAEYPPKAT